MKARGDSNAVTVGFTRRISRIARVHQFGLKDARRAAPPQYWASPRMI
ncbi:hypothetical protein [Pseudomonas fluorescens]|nr:hypothetical protein [Pseudomonas fluorescens]